VLLLIFSLGFFVVGIQATEFTSPNFKVLDPVVNDAGSAMMSSTSYRLYGVVGELSTGRSTTSSFTVNAGSLTFPAAVAAPTPAVGGTTVSTTGSAGGSVTSGPTTLNTVFSGRAYPAAAISFFKNGTLVKQVSAAADGAFSGSIEAVTSGNTYTFGLLAKDSAGRSTPLITYTLNIPLGVQQAGIENIFLPSTIELSETSVIQGAKFTARGTAFPGSTVKVEIPPVIESVSRAASTGSWSTTIDTARLNPGTYTLRAKAQINGDQSETSAPQILTITAVSTPPVVPTPPSPPISPILPTPSSIPGAPTYRRSDINFDNAVNLADISILLAFWKQTGDGIANPRVDINQDNIVDLVDFSILLFNWTG